MMETYSQSWTVQRRYPLERTLPNGQTAVVVSGEGLTAEAALADLESRREDMIAAISSEA